MITRVRIGLARRVKQKTNTTNNSNNNNNDSNNHSSEARSSDSTRPAVLLIDVSQLPASLMSRYHTCIRACTHSYVVTSMGPQCLRTQSSAHRYSLQQPYLGHHSTSCASAHALLTASTPVHVCVYIHIYIYIYICIIAYVCRCRYVFTHVCVCIYIYIYICIYVYTHIEIYVYICIYICIYVYTCVCI